MTRNDGPSTDDRIRREILNLEEACALLRVSSKTLAKALRAEDIPARKIGREWKFSRSALIAWVGAGKARDYARQEQEDGVANEGGGRAVEASSSGGTYSFRPRRVRRDTFSVDED